MTAVPDGANSQEAEPRYHFDRHTAGYRENFLDVTHEMHQICPIAWTDTYDGHWVAAGGQQVFELARCPQVSNDHDVRNERRGYKGIGIPAMIETEGFRGGMLEMDDPEHRFYRTALNPYLSPAAVKRWEPFVDEIARACIDDHIESGRIDFVDDLANVVPAVLTLAMLGVPLEKWTMYNEPAHASVYTPPDSPDSERVRALYMAMVVDLFTNLAAIREVPRPGIINALARIRIDGQAPPDIELIGMLNLLIGGGFDTTTALTPAPGDGRTVSDDLAVGDAPLKEGQRLWESWAMANRHFSFGLGVHRCIGSNVARTVFKSMVTAVLDRLPDYECDPAAAVHYDTIGVIQGMRHLPATFTPRKRSGPGVAETVERLQKICDEQGLARPITEMKASATISD